MTEREEIPTSVKFNFDFLNYTPKLSRAYDFAKQQGLVGEKKNFLILLLVGLSKNYGGIESLSGCITGDAIVEIKFGEKIRKYTIKKAYELFNEQTILKNKMGPKYVFNKYNEKRFMYRTFKPLIKCVVNNKIVFRPFDHVVYSGKKVVYELTLSDGIKSTILATKDHKFLTAEGLKPLKDLEKYEKIYFMNATGDRVRLVKVEEKRRIGKRDVYDIINVLEAKNFIANRFVVSNSGKSIITDILFNKEKLDTILFPEEKVFVLSLSSKTAPSYMHKEINKADIILIEELQKASNSLEVIEMLKNLAEGKDSKRVVTNVRGYKPTVDTLKIKRGKGIIYTLAVENKHKTDEEMKRRFIVLDMDVSNTQTEKVKRRKAQERFLRSRLMIMDDAEINNLKSHIAECMNMKDKFIFDNPFAEYLVSIMPTPNQKIRSFVNHYFNLIDAVALFNHKNRVKFVNEEEVKKSKKFKDKQHLLINIEDVLTIHLIYGEAFSRDIYGIPPLGFQVLDAIKHADKQRVINKKQLELSQFRELNEDELENLNPLKLSEIQKELDKRNIHISHKILKQTCEQLVEEGFLEKDNSTKETMYYISDDIEEYENSMDIIELFNSGAEMMMKFLPDYFNDWLKSQMDEQGNIYFHNPLTGKDEILIKSEDLKYGIKDEIEGGQIEPIQTTTNENSGGDKGNGDNSELQEGSKEEHTGENKTNGG